MNLENKIFLILPYCNVKYVPIRKLMILYGHWNLCTDFVLVLSQFEKEFKRAWLERVTIVLSNIKIKLRLNALCVCKYLLNH